MESTHAIEGRSYNWAGDILIRKTPIKAHLPVRVLRITKVLLSRTAFDQKHLATKWAAAAAGGKFVHVYYIPISANGAGVSGYVVPRESDPYRISTGGALKYPLDD